MGFKNVTQSAVIFAGGRYSRIIAEEERFRASLNLVANQFADPVKAEDFLHKLYMG
jgi:hypothetical protein